MNEFYAVEPSVFSNTAELKFFMEKFGPESGRYLRLYPMDWRTLVERHLEGLRPIEEARVRSIINNAQKTMRLIYSPRLPYKQDKAWVENVIPLTETIPPRVVEAYCAEPHEHLAAVLMEDMDLPPTAEEQIQSTPSEYVRVTETLLTESAELYFIDPYLNPCRRDRYTVLLEMFKCIAKSDKCQRIVLVARYDDVISKNNETDVALNMKKLKEISGLESKCELVLTLYDDCVSIDQMHPRYLFSIKGGVRLDRGFQQMPKNRAVDVAPISPKLLSRVIEVYQEGQNDMVLKLKLTA